MSPPNVLFDGAQDADYIICLAHGAGAPMDSTFMQATAEGLAKKGLRVARFEFPYMAERRLTQIKKPPNRTPVLLETWNKVIAEIGIPSRLVIGGKSLGGRMASMVADETGVAGLVCLGYPFHSPGKLASPDRLGHLGSIKTPTLICQGTRDPFGMPEEVSGYNLSSKILVHWLADGDHSFKPRKKSGRTAEQNLEEALDAILKFTSGR